MLEINPYNPNLPLVIYSDASFPSGFGFIMGQYLENGAFNVIQCASTGITPSQKNYSTYELELTGLSWAFKKVHHYIAHNAHRLTFFTDHAALAHLETVQLDTIRNPRVLMVVGRFVMP